MHINPEYREHWLNASQNKGSKKTTYGRTTENKLSKEGWTSINKFNKQKEEIGEERILGVLDKLFGDAVLNEKDLYGLSQEEIGIEYVKGNIPSEIDLVTFVEMIENAGTIDTDEDF